MVKKIALVVVVLVAGILAYGDRPGSARRTPRQSTPRRSESSARQRLPHVEQLVVA
jgi:hypothetical protein